MQTQYLCSACAWPGLVSRALHTGSHRMTVTLVFQDIPSFITYPEPPNPHQSPAGQSLDHSPWNSLIG